MGHRCCNKQKVKRGLWSPEEDDKLIKHITTHGHGSWSSVPKLAGLQRCGKSCRLRWINYLRPDLKKGTFTQEEEQIIIDVHRILGNRWAQIAKHLPGRTDNEVKNFWNSCIKKKLMSQGLDPQTHNLMSSHQTKIPNNKNITSFVISQNHHTKQPIRSSSIFSESSHEVIINSSSNSYPPNNILTLPNAQTTSISSFNYQYQNPSNSTSNSNSGSTITSTSAAAMNLKAQNPSQYDNITPNITTPNIASSSSSSVNVQNLSRPGLLDDFGIWGSSFEPFEAPRIISEGNQQSLPGQDHDPDHDDHQNQQLQDHEKEKIWEMEIDKVGNYSSFDLGFMESTLNISGVMCHDLTSMEYDLAWNY